MFGSAELDCQSAQNDVRVDKKLATLNAEDAGGGRLQALLLAYPRHKAILFHEVDLSRYDINRRLYQSTPVALLHLDYTLFSTSTLLAGHIVSCCAKSRIYCVVCIVDL